MTGPPLPPFPGSGSNSRDSFLKPAIPSFIIPKQRSNRIDERLHLNTSEIIGHNSPSIEPLNTDTDVSSSSQCRVPLLSSSEIYQNSNSSYASSTDSNLNNPNSLSIPNSTNYNTISLSPIISSGTPSPAVSPNHRQPKLHLSINSSQKDVTTPAIPQLIINTRDLPSAESSLSSAVVTLGSVNSQQSQSQISNEDGSSIPSDNLSNSQNKNEYEFNGDIRNGASETLRANDSTSLVDSLMHISLNGNPDRKIHLNGSPVKEKDDLYTKDINELDESEWEEIYSRGEIEVLEVIGEGNGGSVKKCKLKTTGSVIALKTILPEPSPEIQKQIIRELNYNKRFHSPYIVQYYGTFFNSSTASISICMEYMGGKSLDAIYKQFRKNEGRIGEKPLGKIAEGVLKGLSYLNQQKIMHRDIKPQNVLLNKNGDVKLCDFGVSGEVVNSLATTFAGTSFYMAPERIRNEPYTITCDVWSLGLTLLEGSLGHFPLVDTVDDEKLLSYSPIDLLMIILSFTPSLEDEPDEGISWSKSFKSFLQIALTKESRSRPSPRQMLEHPWMVGQMSKKVKMDKLVASLWGDNLD